MAAGPRLQLTAATERPAVECWECEDPPPPPCCSLPRGGRDSRSHTPFTSHHGWLLLRKSGRGAEAVADKLLGTKVQALCWDRYFAELFITETDDIRLAFWLADSDHAAAGSPRSSISLEHLDGLVVSDQELTMHFRAQQSNKPIPRRKLSSAYKKLKTPPPVRLRADTTQEAEDWASAMRAATAARLRAVLPSSWNLDAIVEGVGSADSSALVAKETLSDDVSMLMQRILDHTFICKSTRDRRADELPLRLEVTEVVSVQNGPAWIDYRKSRSEIAARAAVGAQQEPLAPPILTSSLDNSDVKLMLGALHEAANEHWLFHGTTSSAVEHISNHEFRMDLAGSNRGTLYGRGVYMAECSSKADEYAEEDENGVRAILLCRVSLGKTLVNADRYPRESLKSECMSSFDSLCGDRWKAVGTYREFVLYNSAQVYPAYIIYYRRIVQAELLLRIRGITDDNNLQEAVHIIPQAAKLAASYPDPDVRYRIALVLSANDAVAVHALTKALVDEERLVRQTAACALVEIAANTASKTCKRPTDHAPEVAKAVPLLIDRVSDTDECVVVRRSCVKALGQLNRYAQRSVPLLITLVENEDAGIRAACTTSVGQILSTMATIPKEVVPALSVCLADPHPEVTSAAALTLGSFGMAAASAASPLVACLETNDSDSVRRDAAIALGSIGEPSVVKAGAVPVLVACLRDDDAGVRQAAANALGRLYPHTVCAVQGLNDCLRDRDSEVRAAAVKSLGQLNDHSTPAVPSIVHKALKDACDEVRVQAATALGRLHCMGYLGLHVTMVKAAMTERKKDACDRVRSAALMFGQIGKPAVIIQKEKKSTNQPLENSPMCSTWRRTESQMKAIRLAYDAPGKFLGAEPNKTM